MRNRGALYMFRPELAGATGDLADDPSRKAEGSDTPPTDSAAEPRLPDAGRVSMGDAIAAMPRQPGRQETSAKPDSLAEAVLRFQPYSRETATRGDKEVRADAKKLGVANSHGGIYGRGGPDRHQAGGNVGTISKHVNRALQAETIPLSTHPFH